MDPNCELLVLLQKKEVFEYGLRTGKHDRPRPLSRPLAQVRQLGGHILGMGGQAVEHLML